MRSRWSGVALSALVALALSGLAGCSPLIGPSASSAYTPGPTGGVPKYQHIFLIMMENNGYEDIIGSADAPRINALASQYGLATNDWAVAHPSEPNYIALIGGDTFGVGDDNPYTTNAITAPNLATQLEAAHLTWKSYQQSLPSPGYTGTVYPSDSSLYASKHNPFMNFLGAWPVSERPATLAHIVPETQLISDLALGSAPNFSFITPDLCHDMHGSSACADPLTQAGDTFAGDTVDAITASPIWAQGNAAIIITWDEADAGLPDGAPPIASDGGHIATIVITNHGPRGVQDGVPYNHYALLLTIQEAFGLGCLRNSCPSIGHVGPMTKLFATAK